MRSAAIRRSNGAVRMVRAAGSIHGRWGFSMRRLTIALGLGLIAAAPAVAGQTSVAFRPRTEASPLVWRSASERDAVYGTLARLLTRLGDRELPPGRSLSVTLVDIRPAGQFEPWRPTADDVRFLRDTTPPSVTLRYRLEERGRVVASGEETVTDLNYLWNISARNSLSSYPYETALMRDWFRDRIIRLKPKPR